MKLFHDKHIFFCTEIHRYKIAKKEGVNLLIEELFIKGKLEKKLLVDN